MRWIDEVGERRLKAGRGIPLRQAAIGVAVFYAACLLLNGEALYRNAEQLTFGAPREIVVRLAAPLRWISRTTGLYRIRELIEQAWNKEPLP
jgi:hypothetical protein